MTHAHVCDECKTVAPLSSATLWWRLESIEGVIHYGEKSEYHFCSWNCISSYSHRISNITRTSSA